MNKLEFKETVALRKLEQEISACERKNGFLSFRAKAFAVMVATVIAAGITGWPTIASLEATPGYVALDKTVLHSSRSKTTPPALSASLSEHNFEQGRDIPLLRNAWYANLQGLHFRSPLLTSMR